MGPFKYITLKGSLGWLHFLYWVGRYIMGWFFGISAISSSSAKTVVRWHLVLTWYLCWSIVNSILTISLHGYFKWSRGTGGWELNLLYIYGYWGGITLYRVGDQGSSKMGQILHCIINIERTPILQVFELSFEQIKTFILKNVHNTTTAIYIWKTLQQAASSVCNKTGSDGWRSTALIYRWVK